jgi:hypothetical protein
MRKYFPAGLFVLPVFLVCGCAEQSSDSPKSEMPKDVQTVDAGQILYTLPTICEKLPPLEKTAQLPKDSIRMHEDYWRQIELVPIAYRSQVEDQLKSFIAFRDAHKKGGGYSEIFIRKNVYPTLQNQWISLANLGARPVGLALGDQKVVGGFAIPDKSGAYLYGHTEPRGIIIYLGLESSSAGNLTPEFASFVSNFASSQKLFMVDWYKGQIIPEVTAETLKTWAGHYKSKPERGTPP